MFRLVEVVEMRDSIVQCFERDRLREVEEDKSVTAQLNKFSAGKSFRHVHKRPIHTKLIFDLVIVNDEGSNIL